jgi:uncharacterized membrane protein
LHKADSEREKRERVTPRRYLQINIKTSCGQQMNISKIDEIANVVDAIDTTQLDRINYDLVQLLKEKLDQVANEAQDNERPSPRA